MDLQTLDTLAFWTRISFRGRLEPLGRSLRGRPSTGPGRLHLRSNAPPGPMAVTPVRLQLGFEHPASVPGTQQAARSCDFC